MILNSFDVEKEFILDGAKQMLVSARTAPKARGMDSISLKILTDDDLVKLGEYAIQKGEERDLAYFVRDGKIIKNCHAILIIGVSNNYLGLNNCGFCGFENCGACSKAKGHCAIKLADLGIAVGSAVNTAMNLKIDNRVLYSIGKCAVELNILEDENITNAYAIGLSVSGKSVFFDREPIKI